MYISKKEEAEEVEEEEEEERTDMRSAIASLPQRPTPQLYSSSLLPVPPSGDEPRTKKKKKVKSNHTRMVP
jgi:hypothetical protein